MPPIIASVVATWSTAFSDHGLLRTAVGFLHIAGLIGGGGSAIAADRMTLRASARDAATRMAQLDAIRTTHRVVLAGLASLFVSGLLLFAADLDTYAASKVFWLKMALITLLLANGGAMMRAERQAARGGERAWRHLHYISVVSLALWFLITLAGAALPNI